MNRRISFFYFSLFIAVSSSIILSCTRINDATDLGDGLIPLVDNVNTFDTTITVETYNDSFWLSNSNPLLTDSFRISKRATHILGKISNDPLFGSTDAKIYLQLKPFNYKYAFENHSDSLYIDSVVLILDYVETYGDTNALQTVQVSEIATSSVFRYDSNYLIRQATFPTIGVLGSKNNFAPNILNDSIKAYKDTTKNQLRIRLSDAFGTRLLLYDSTATGAYFSDSAFNSKFRGFAIESTSGNALMGFNLASGKTRLALYYRYKNVPRQDTTVRYFTFDGVSANANYITRNNYIGSQAFPTFGNGQDALVYLQNTPGTFARIKIPDLLNTPNCVVHRAELIAEQIYDASDLLFTRPDALLLDVRDTALKFLYRFMPYDFEYNQGTRENNGFQLGYAGKKTVDAFGNPITVWKFNISRYVQNVLTRREPLHELRISTSPDVVGFYQPSILGGGVPIQISLNSSIGKGRVRLAGGNYADPTKKMRLRIVYSKI